MKYEIGCKQCDRTRCAAKGTYREREERRLHVIRISWDTGFYQEQNVQNRDSRGTSQKTTVFETRLVDHVNQVSASVIFKTQVVAQNYNDKDRAKLPIEAG